MSCALAGVSAGSTTHGRVGSKRTAKPSQSLPGCDESWVEIVLPPPLRTTSPRGSSNWFVVADCRIDIASVPPKKPDMSPR